MPQTVSCSQDESPKECTISHYIVFTQTYITHLNTIKQYINRISSRYNYIFTMFSPTQKFYER